MEQSGRSYLVALEINVCYEAHVFCLKHAHFKRGQSKSVEAIQGPCVGLLHMAGAISAAEAFRSRGRCSPYIAPAEPATPDERGEYRVDSFHAWFFSAKVRHRWPRNTRDGDGAKDS